MHAGHIAETSVYNREPKIISKTIGTIQYQLSLIYISDFYATLGRDPSFKLEWEPRTIAHDPNLPKHFDSRDKWPHCRLLHLPAINQGCCGSCWVAIILHYILQILFCIL